MPPFSTFRLDRDRLGEALPLVRMAIPQIDPARWMAYCDDLVRRDGGVLVAAAADDDLHGLAIYRPDEDLRLGRIVRIDALVAFELNPSNPVRRALCEAVETLCGTLEAGGILVTITERDSGGSGSTRAQGWESAGFRRHGTALWKPRGIESRMSWSQAG